MKRTPLPTAYGFTLLEVLLAMVILSIISITLWTTFSNCFRMREQIDTIEDQTQSIMTLISKLDRDFSTAFIVREKKYATLFHGKDNGVQDEVTFSCMANRVYDETPKSDQGIISYFTQTNPQDPKLFDLYRWSHPFIEDDQYWGERRGELIFSGLQRFDLQYYSQGQYKPEWDTEQSDMAGKLPEAVKVSLETASGQNYNDLFVLALNAGPLGAKTIATAAEQGGGGTKPPANQPGKPNEPQQPQPPLTPQPPPDNLDEHNQ